MRFSRRLLPGVFVAHGALLTTAVRAATKEGAALRDALLREAEAVDTPQWKPMLRYLAELHGRSVHPPTDHFPYPWENIGPGYQNGSAFGHIDLTHQRLDTVRAMPEHAKNQTL